MPKELSDSNLTWTTDPTKLEEIYIWVRVLNDLSRAEIYLERL